VTDTHSFFIREKIPAAKKVARRQKTLKSFSGTPVLAGSTFPFDIEKISSQNCENLVGSVAIPVGIAGPSPVEISFEGKTEKYPSVVFPLATTEGALVASINRGARCLAAAGGAKVSVKNVGMSRAPVFVCKDGAAAKQFIAWIEANTALFEEAAKATSSHLHFLSVTTYVEESFVFVRVAFDTDEAMGMNMVSIALDYWWNTLVPDKIKNEVQMVALSGNVCGDKKPAQITRKLGRGYWVRVSAHISSQVLGDILHVDAKSLFNTHYAKNIVGSRVAGIPAPNMHVANAVAAFFLATGQDSAHVVDVASSASVSFMLEGDALAVELHMPSVPVGTVGGGTALPQQKEWLSQCIPQKITAADLAAFVAVAALCGELSGLAALSTQTLASAHAKLGRSKKKSQEAV